jgi:hypothetical protein
MTINGKNTNYVKNRFFGKEINKYLSKNEIIKAGVPYYYYNIDYGAQQCSTCNITNQLTDLDFLGNKRKLYQNIIREKPNAINYLPLSIFFTKTNTEILKSYLSSNTTWIIKPENEMSGKGIFLAKSMNEIKKGIAKYPKLNDWILQKYITPPLLYKGYKFHIRRYVLVNINNKKNLELYLYKNGIMYISDKKFDNSNNNTSFLSGSGSLIYSDNQMLQYPDEYIQEFGSSLFNVNRQMEKIVVESIDSVSDRLRCPNSKNLNYQCYKLMGYDFLIDEYHKVYLGEINVRIISIKFPPKDFKMKMYNDILDIVFYKKTNPDFKLLFVKKILNESFTTNNSDYQVFMALLLICWWIYLFFY